MCIRFYGSGPGNLLPDNVGSCDRLVDRIWNVMAHAQKPDFVFRRNGRVHLNRRGRQFSRLLAAEVCASAVVMLDTPCYEVVWRVLATHSIRQFPLHFPSRASPCATTFELDSTTPRSAVLKILASGTLTGLHRTFCMLIKCLKSLSVYLPLIGFFLCHSGQLDELQCRVGKRARRWSL
jgi:hypothetical protein